MQIPVCGIIYANNGILLIDFEWPSKAAGLHLYPYLKRAQMLKILNGKFKKSAYTKPDARQ